MLSCWSRALLILAFLLPAKVAWSTAPLSGGLKAERDCAAVSSIKRGSNPGSVRLVPGETYRILGKNREDATHFKIRVEGAQPADRWVEIDCGNLVAAPVESATEPVRPSAPAEARGPAGTFVLAASWQQAFCEIRPSRTECREDRTRSREQDRFSLHGLWPEPSDKVYCGVTDWERGFSERGPWRQLPVLNLTDETRGRLSRSMPGTLSYLHRHQWTKHGTCYGTDEETYFRHSLLLLDRLNASPVRELFASHVGRHLSSRQIRETFDRAFGRGAGERVRVDCEDGMIMELQISLAGRIGDDVSLAELMRAAKRRSVGCRGGRVDAAGVGD
jgi:ribonuclease T2